MNEILLDFLHGLGFGHSGFEVFVELLHEEGGGGVVDLPEGGDDGFGSAVSHEVMTDACNF